MPLSEVQQEFTYCVALLVIWAYHKGYRLTYGDAHRSKEEARRLGFENSNHTRRLAVDFNLFIDGEYKVKTEDYRPLGEYWVSLHPQASWGGDYDDGNHFSFYWNGVA